MAITKSVVVISSTGRLIDVTGENKEADQHYVKFASRLLGDDGAYAVLDYGWNNKTKLKITGTNGQEILLNAQEVLISGALKINGTPIQTIINNSIDLELTGIKGTQGQIIVSSTSNPSSAQPGQSRKLYTISISDDFLDRIETLEEEVAGLFRFDEVYYTGDGLVTDRDTHRINVILGTGLKFEPQEYDVSEETDSSDSPIHVMKNAVAVDCDTVPTESSVKPITSGAVFDALDAAAPRYVISVDNTTGNVVLYDMLS